MIYSIQTLWDTKLSLRNEDPTEQINLFYMIYVIHFKCWQSYECMIQQLNNELREFNNALSFSPISVILNSEIRMIPILSSVWGEHFYAQAGTGEQKALCFMTHLRRGRLRKASDYSVFSLFLKFLKIFHFSRFSVSAYYIQNPSETRVGKLITEHPAANLRL